MIVRGTTIRAKMTTKMTRQPRDKTVSRRARVRIASAKPRYMWRQSSQQRWRENSQWKQNGETRVHSSYETIRAEVSAEAGDNSEIGCSTLLPGPLAPDEFKSSEKDVRKTQVTPRRAPIDRLIERSATRPLLGVHR